MKSSKKPLFSPFELFAFWLEAHYFRIRLAYLIALVAACFILPGSSVIIAVALVLMVLGIASIGIPGFTAKVTESKLKEMAPYCDLEADELMAEVARSRRFFSHAPSFF